jgi:hypothetical protein
LRLRHTLSRPPRFIEGFWIAGLLEAPGESPLADFVNVRLSVFFGLAVARKAVLGEYNRVMIGSRARPQPLHYAHLYPEAMRDAAEKMDAFFNSVASSEASAQQNRKPN